MGNSPVVTFRTLGCKLNQAEAELLAERFAVAGYRITDGDSADICILNTCTVTHVADRKSRHILRLLRKRNPTAFIIATGCYAERSRQELARIGVDLVVGNEQKMDLLNLVERSFTLRSDRSAVDHVGGVSRVRSFVRIQDGCDDFCSYCIVPMVRGREFCLPVPEIVDVVKSKVAAGYKEVILTGTKIGAYNYEGFCLMHLVQQILEEAGIQRLHISSLQPKEISENLIRLWLDPRLSRHFHLALQSGSDAVLKRMRRRYSTDDYGKAVALIRRVVPDAAITTDVMAGFPGESDEEFEESYSFCRDMNFADFHVFSYSARPGTSAAGMSGQVGDRIKKERSQRMLSLAEESALSFRRRFLGRVMMVLWENEVEPGSGLYSGLNDNYIRVFARSSKSLTNLLLPVRLVGLHEQGLWGEIVT